jgi:flagellar protein FliL
MAKKGKTAPDIVPEGDAPKKSKKKLIIIVVLVLLLGGIGYKFTLGKGAAPAKPAMVAGKVVPLESINLNLAGGHYLKLGLALQATTLATESPDGSKALDIAIDLLSNRSLAELATTDERNKLQKELVTKVNKAYEDEVMDVYFTEFVTQ